MKQIDVTTEESDHRVMVYLCGKYSPYDESGGVMMSLSYDVTERLSLTLSSLLALADNGSLTLSLGSDVSLNDSVSLSSSGSWMRDFEEGDNLYLFTFSFKGSF